MSKVVGIDTSNYTTSLAVFDTNSLAISNFKKLLPVKKGQLGLRQSDAVFHHTRQLAELIGDAGALLEFPCAVGVSVKPRLVEGSYMPCFLAGHTAACSMAAACNAKLFTTSHQTGHILAALFSCGRTDLLSSERFLAFHVSGGTTDLLLCTPDRQEVIQIADIGHSLDLKAGQLIDRTGVMLGLDFPCGAQLEQLAEKSVSNFKIKATVRDGCCSLSGVENKVKEMFERGESREDIAAYAIDYVFETVSAMTEKALDKWGQMPVIFCGGVMSDKIIVDKLRERFDCFFASPEYSCDNAAGVAVYAAIKGGLL